MNILRQFSSYLTAQDKRLAKTTIKNYTSDITSFIAWFEKTTKKTFNPRVIGKENIKGYKQSLQVSHSSEQRYLSSLRKFFHFLQAEEMITHNPFAKEKKKDTLYDKWKLNDFTNYLYIYNISELTIKYYLLDIKHFLKWFEKEKGNSTKTLRLAEEYTHYLLQQQNYAPATLNRKQAAIRKYLMWQHPENTL